MTPATDTETPDSSSSRKQVRQLSSGSTAHGNQGSKPQRKKVAANSSARDMAHEDCSVVVDRQSGSKVSSGKGRHQRASAGQNHISNVQLNCVEDMAHASMLQSDVQSPCYNQGNKTPLPHASPAGSQNEGIVIWEFSCYLNFHSFPFYISVWQAIIETYFSPS
jgi:hypothetical protein